VDRFHSNSILVSRRLCLDRFHSNSILVNDNVKKMVIEDQMIFDAMYGKVTLSEGWPLFRRTILHYRMYIN
jgi:hypothetical protein